ncbi:MAG: imidazole glycerol phosphate synthase subunit HisF [Candidatus Gracilibacteria bacterium]
MKKTIFIPAIDLIGGRCVRLTQGAYDACTSYDSSPIQMARLFERMGYEWLHIIDLEGARAGELKNLKIIREIVAQTSLKVQVGGGIRSLSAIKELLNSGVARVLIGSLAVKEPDVVAQAIQQFGTERIAVAMDVRGGEVCISGWEEKTGLAPEIFVEKMKTLGVTVILCTDIESDGMMKGPNVELYARLVREFPGIKWIAAGGVSFRDRERLQQVGVDFAVMGKAFYEGNFLAKRVIPCLDIKEGRVVKGASFTNLKDAGDPVKLAAFYDREGADELVFLDITATSDKRKMVADLAQRVSKAISIPFTIGGGISTVEDVKNALQAGADKVSIESAAVLNPGLVSEAAALCGSQAVVISVSPRRAKSGWEIFIKGGRENTGRDLVEFLREMQERGAGEILLNSVDEDGQGNGYDLEMLKAARDVLTIPLIASSGAGELEHFYDGIAQGGADAVLAASVFHYGKFSVQEVKNYLSTKGVCMRNFSPALYKKGVPLPPRSS